MAPVLVRNDEFGMESGYSAPSLCASFLNEGESVKQTDQTLLEQMRITELEVEHRKALFSFSAQDAELLASCRTAFEGRVDALVAEFYQRQTSVPEIALLIGDADTLARLRSAQRRYVLDLFSGIYDLEYVNNRLRIGLVHKRIGVEPKLYLSAVHSLKELLERVVVSMFPADQDHHPILMALGKLFLFDISLVFDTYIRSLVIEVETAKDRSERYARSMEEKVKERTRQLDEMSRNDALTGLLNVRYLDDIVTTALRSAQRRAEPVTAIYLDVNDFKAINDTQGHQRGDEILRSVGAALKRAARMEDSCIRYGGDEFLVILPNCGAQQARGGFIERFKQVIEEGGNGVSLSIGIAQTGPTEYADAKTLVRLADESMYAEKKAHREADQASGA